MDIHELKKIAVELMQELKKSGLGEVEIETDDAKIKIQSASPVQTAIAPQMSVAAPAQQASAESVATQTVAVEETISGTEVKSPLVGTFYSSPSPDAPPFVLVGQKVKKGDVLFIVEAMKTMNEITASCDGTVLRVLAQPGDMVEYNQTVVIIEE